MQVRHGLIRGLCGGPDNAFREKGTPSITKSLTKSLTVPKTGPLRTLVLDRRDMLTGVWCVLQVDISFVNASVSKHRIFHIIPGTKLQGAAADKAREISEREYAPGPFAFPWPNRIEGKLRNLYEGHKGPPFVVLSTAVPSRRQCLSSGMSSSGSSAH